MPRRRGQPTRALRGQTARRRCWLAAIEGGMGAVAGEDVLAVDGEPGANPFPG